MEAQIYPKQVCNTIHALLRDQVQMSYMDKRVVMYIMENRLVQVHRWPAWCIALTDAGAEYLHENTEWEED